MYREPAAPESSEPQRRRSPATARAASRPSLDRSSAYPSLDLLKPASACRTSARSGFGFARGGREDRSRQSWLLGALGVRPGSGTTALASWACCSKLAYLHPGETGGVHVPHGPPAAFAHCLRPGRPGTAGPRHPSASYATICRCTAASACWPDSA
jgi:hypothetical protein